MALKEELEAQGNWLFIRRSYLPIIVFLVCIAGMYNFRFPNGNPEFNVIWFNVCFLVSLFGLFIRAFVIGYAAKNTSGRNTTAGQVADTVNSSGIYSLVRHPLYLGNFFMWLGVIIYPMNLPAAIFGILGFWIYYERIMFAEEQFLIKKFGDKYLSWAEHTPAFWPKLKGYSKPQAEFSIKHIIKREYLGLYAPIICLVILSTLGHYQVYQQWSLDKVTQMYLIIGTSLFLLIRIIVKFTKVLNVEDR